MDTETEIDLKPFCDRSSSRYCLGEPYARAGKTYATDGRIGIALDTPGTPDTVIEGSFPRVWDLISKCDFTGGFEAIPADLPLIESEREIWCRHCDGSGETEEIVNESITVDCEECDGTGEMDCCECGQTTDCDECDGSGEVQIDEHFKPCPHCKAGAVKTFTVTLFGKWFDHYYIEQVSKLPNAEVALWKDGMLLFRFNGGVGIVMELVSI